MTSVAICISVNEAKKTVFIAIKLSSNMRNPPLLSWSRIFSERLWVAVRLFWRHPDRNIIKSNLSFFYTVSSIYTFFYFRRGFTLCAVDRNRSRIAQRLLSRVWSVKKIKQASKQCRALLEPDTVSILISLFFCCTLCGFFRVRWTLVYVVKDIFQLFFFFFDRSLNLLRINEL